MKFIWAEKLYMQSEGSVLSERVLEASQTHQFVRRSSRKCVTSTCCAPDRNLKRAKNKRSAHNYTDTPRNAAINVEGDIFLKGCFMSLNKYQGPVCSKYKREVHLVIPMAEKMGNPLQNTPGLFKLSHLLA